MRYCQQCDAQLGENAKFCANCGTPAFQTSVEDRQALIDKLSSRLKTNGVIWIAIAIYQIACAFHGDFAFLIIGVLNIFSAINDIKASKRILENQNGIVAAFEPVVRPIIVLLYNLFIGGVIGIVGSVYYLIFIRGFVMENKTRFLVMETVTQKADTIHVSVIISPQEASAGTEKGIYVDVLQKRYRITFQKI